MNHPLVKLAYRQRIDYTTPGRFEKAVFNDSYSEFLVQFQTYNQSNNFTTWQQLRGAIPKANVTLQYKVGFAIGLYVRELGGQIPGGLCDTEGRVELPFAEHRFELLDSDTTDKTAHRIALSYLTAPLRWLGTVGDCLLLSAEAEPSDTGFVETFLLQVRPGVSIRAVQVRTDA